MGGPGSGNRWRYGAKSTTDDYRILDVRRWARDINPDAGRARPRDHDLPASQRRR